MFRLERAYKTYNEAGSFNEQVNLFGFIDDHVFLTKSGDVGVVLRVQGVDYECLDSPAIDTLTKRLESAFKVFDEKCRVYQYVFKQNHAQIPYQAYANPVVDTAIQCRVQYLQSKADNLYALEIYYVILFEGFRYRNSLLATLPKLASDARGAWKELRALLSAKKQITLIDAEIEMARATLARKVQNFILQVSDFLAAEILSKQDAFRLLKRILNFSPEKIDAARLKHDTFLD